MAEAIADYDWSAPNKRPHRFLKYMDGQTWKLTRGIDFKCSMESVRAQLFNASKDARVKIKTRVLDDKTIVVQANAGTTVAVASI